MILIYITLIFTDTSEPSMGWTDLF